MSILNRRGFLGALAAGSAAAKGMANRLWAQIGGITPAGNPNAAFRVQSPSLTVELSREGGLVGLVLGKKAIRWPVRGGTSLAGCKLEGAVISGPRPDGGVRFTKTLSGEIAGARREVTLVESFFPTQDSVRWEMRLDGHGAPWSTPIETRLEIDGAARKKFWTAWGAPEPDDPALLSQPWPDVFYNSLNWFDAKDGPKWSDPLVLTPFLDRTFYYGSVYYQYAKASSYWYMPIFNDTFCLPLATVADEENDTGMTLALSPEDILLDMTMESTAAGGIKFSRLFRRISEQSPVGFAMDLTSHEPGWRGGVRWMTERYPQYFHPPLEKAGELGGTAAYSTYEGDLDAEKFKRMAFTLNWKMASDFPFIGLWIPPVRDGEKWTRLKPWSDEPKFYIGPFASVPQMAEYSRRMRQAGFYVLNYFNATEFGDHVKYPAPPYRRSPSDPDFWKDSNDFLYGRFSDAIVLHSPKTPPDGQWGAGYSKAPGPMGGGWTWGCILLDCAEPCYQDFMLDQARKLIEKIPDSSGMCIDRLDTLRTYNFERDDGVTWYDGPARSLFTSWMDFSEKLGAVQHQAGQYLFVNNHVKRLDILRYVDGLYDEHADFGPSKNMNALLGVFKPCIAWVREQDKFKPDPDTFMQRFLYLGTFPMAPFPQNDHSILPSAEGDRIYTDYGPLFAALRGRKWVLLPHAVQVEPGEARANLFRVPGGYVAPVIFGGPASTASLTLSGLPEIMAGQASKCEVIHPGEETWQVCPFRQKGSEIAIRVPLSRGCAVVRISV